MTRVLIGVGLGLAVGTAVGAFLKSRGGVCPLTCNPIGGAIFGAILGGLIAWPAAGQRAFATIDHFQTINTVEEFDQKALGSDRLVLVDFYSPSCPPCQRLAPVLGALSQDYADRVTFAKVNVDQAPAVREKFNVTGWPTILLVRDGKIVDRWMGYSDKADVAGRLDAALQSNPEETTPPSS